MKNGRLDWSSYRTLKDKKAYLVQHTLFRFARNHISCKTLGICLIFLQTYHDFSNLLLTKTLSVYLATIQTNTNGKSKELFCWRRGENSVRVDENLVSYFPAGEYNGIDDLAETIMNPANCRTSQVMLPTKDNINFIQHEPVYVYMILSNQIWLEILMCDY